MGWVRRVLASAVLVATLTGCTSSNNSSACTEALNAADRLHNTFAKVLVVQNDALEAAYLRDADRLQRDSAQMEILTREVAENPYGSLRDQCR